MKFQKHFLLILDQEITWNSIHDHTIIIYLKSMKKNGKWIEI